MKLPGTATAEENIHIAMGKLAIKRGDLFLDVGCGSGAVSLAASHYTDHIYGLDRRPEAVKLSQDLVPGGEFLLGEAEEIIPRLPAVDSCFIGGTRVIDLFLPLLLYRASPGCMIVADLARMGIASQVVDLMKRLGIYREILQINISRGYDLAGDIALRPINPIFMVIGKC